MRRIEKHKTELLTSYVFDGSRIVMTKHKVLCDKKLMYSEVYFLSDRNAPYNQPLHKFYEWVVNLSHEAERGQNRLSDRRNFLGFIKKFWRKFFTKEVYLEI